MLSDTLFEAVREIEEYEAEFPESYGDLAENLRKVKVEMLLVQLSLDLPPGIWEHYLPADYDWLRAESLTRAATKAPHEFSAAFYECLGEMRITKFGK